MGCSIEVWGEEGGLFWKRLEKKGQFLQLNIFVRRDLLKRKKHTEGAYMNGVRSCDKRDV